MVSLPWFPSKPSPAADASASASTAAASAIPALAAGFRSTPGSVCLVTGSSGLCGARLVEMLLERGASRVVCFDKQAFPPDRLEALQLKYPQSKLTVLSGEHGDLTSDAAVLAAFQLIAPASYDVVYHLGALVGPFYDRDTYHKVNHYGTLRLIQQCQRFHCTRFVYSSSPSTRFTGHNILGKREDQLQFPLKKYLAMYAEAKAYGEIAVSQAHCWKNQDDGDDQPTDSSSPVCLRTISVAPHQVYGPHDSLMLPALLETAAAGRLRIFGRGRNQISVTFVDNYCHGLLCGADALLARPHQVGGKFYIVTDGNTPVYFWHWLNQAVVGLGFQDLWSKYHLPVWLLYAVAYLCNLLGYLTQTTFKLNPFNVTMLTIHRYFCIDNAMRDLEYAPVQDGTEAWQMTIEWFRVHWLPNYLEGKQRKKVPVNKKLD
jgi:nucleoside-diphosphate-sugar epimerase